MTILRSSYINIIPLVCDMLEFHIMVIFWFFVTLSLSKFIVFNQAKCKDYSEIS